MSAAELAKRYMREEFGTPYVEYLDVIEWLDDIEAHIETDASDDEIYDAVVAEVMHMAELYRDEEN